jgi:1-carboxybiuret hydrolase
VPSSLETGFGPPPEAGCFAQVDVAELAGELRTGRRTARDLVEAALDAAHRWQPVLNAFVTLDAAGARAAADEAVRELAAGVDRGPLHGIPIAIKDLVDVRGLPTTAGSRHLAGHRAAADAACVRRLRAAGAVIIGKTTTHEFAYGPTGDRSATGPTRNPYATGHMAGGSSSGSAAAVAAGIVPLALGTDTGGSIRIPAACCGVVGLKPTHGAVAVDGVVPVAPALDTVGPLARTAADCRLLWTALTTARRSSAGRPKIGWVHPDSIHPTVPAITRLTRNMVGDLVIGEIDAPEIGELREVYRVVQGSQAYAGHAERLDAAPELYGAEVRQRLLAGGAVRGWEYVRALEVRERARATVAALLRDHDLLALPTIPLPPPALDSRVARIDGEPVDVPAALLALTAPWSVLGLPAVSLPAGFVDGLPAGLQLVGPPGSELRLLAVAEHLQHLHP